jgi:hypothetical protein
VAPMGDLIGWPARLYFIRCVVARRASLLRGKLEFVVDDLELVYSVEILASGVQIHSGRNTILWPNLCFSKELGADSRKIKPPAKERGLALIG